MKKCGEAEVDPGGADEPYAPDDFLKAKLIKNSSRRFIGLKTIKSLLVFSFLSLKYILFGGAISWVGLLDLDNGAFLNLMCWISYMWMCGLSCGPPCLRLFSKLPNKTRWLDTSDGVEVISPAQNSNDKLGFIICDWSRYIGNGRNIDDQIANLECSFLPI